MSGEEKLEKRLEGLGLAMGRGESMVEDVMRRIEGLGAGAASSRRIALHTKIWRNIMNARFIKYAAAAVVVIGLIGLFAWLMGGNGGASVAFADVLRHTEETKTVTYIMVPADESGIALHVKYMEPGRMRIDKRITTPGPGRGSETVMIMDFRKKKMLVLDPKRKEAILTEMEPVSAQLSSALIQDDIIEEIKNLRVGTEVALGTKQLDGCQAAGFLVRKEQKDYTIWADVKTKLPIRIEFVAISPNGNMRTRIALTNIQFDVPLDESLFALEAPKTEGYTSKYVADIRRQGLRNYQKNCLKQLSTACYLYAKDHDGQWPDSLGELSEYGVTERILANPIRPQMKPGYKYIKPSGKPEAGQLLIYEMYDEWEDGISVVLWPVEIKLLTDEEEFKKLLEKATGE